MLYLFLIFLNLSFPGRNIACGIAASKSIRNPPDSIILDNWVFENFILADEPFAKALQTCVLVNNNFCANLI